MPGQTLEIRITKGRDGANTLTCTRDDGTSTWAKVHDYFPVHDMAHYVVETVLRVPGAFYSLVLDGWDISDFEVKGAGKQLPFEANLVEALVGRLQRDLLPGVDFTAATFNEEVDAVMEGIGNPARRPVTPDELDAIRSGLKELLARWKVLAPGESLGMIFHRIAQ